VTFESLPVVRNHTRLGSTLALESRTTSPERARWHQRQRSCTGVLKHGATLSLLNGLSALHSHNWQPCPQQQGATTQAHKHARRSAQISVAALYRPILAQPCPFRDSRA